MRRSLLTVVSDPLAGVNIGDAFLGGYYAGIIDTTVGNIDPSDASQTGLRYALIIAGADLESTSLAWKTTGTAGPTGVRTRWDGRAATAAMAAFGSTYPAANYCAGLSYPSDGATEWYLLAMDEFELVYRNLKCSTETNYTTAESASTFPGGTVSMGYNPSSDPAGSAYVSGTPGQTNVTAFQSGNAQALGASGSNIYYWTSTEYSTGNAWMTGVSGSQGGRWVGTTKPTAEYVRPGRRLLLAA